jgi:hypothetical protein
VGSFFPYSRIKKVPRKISFGERGNFGGNFHYFRALLTPLFFWVSPEGLRMDINDWNLLLGKLPSCDWVRNPPANPARIRAVEALVGKQLPQAFRSFLEFSDGAQFRDRRVLGTRELLIFLQRGSPLPGLEGPSANLRKLSGLLPFHPVSRCSFECLDLRETQMPVVWVRLDQVEGMPGDKGLNPSMEVTYVDFLDWFLDLLWTLHHPERELEMSFPSPDPKTAYWKWN